MNDSSTAPQNDAQSTGPKPPVLPTLLELDRVMSSLALLLPDFPVDRIVAITLDPNVVVLTWVPLGMNHDEPGARQTSTIPVANPATLAELNGKGPDL